MSKNNLFSRVSEKKIISNPHLEITHLENERVRIESPFYNLKLEANEKVLSIINAFKKPKNISDFRKEFKVSDDIIETLLNKFFLIDYSEIDLLEQGFFKGASNIVGQSLTWDEIKKISNIISHYGIIGVPIDLGGEYGGAREGPDRIREEVLKLNINLHSGEKNVNIIDYELNRKYDSNTLKVYDLGNITYNIGESLNTIGSRISKLFSECLKKNIKPIVLGGDHSVSWFAIRALSPQYSDFGIIHFDAHHDFYELTTLQKKNLDHGNSFKFALEEPNLRCIHQVGLRTIENFEVVAYKNQNPKVSFVSSFQANKQSAEEIFKSIDKKIPYYLSFDVDCLDFPIYPETGTPIIGGLTFYKTLELMDYLSLNFNIVGCDFVELSPKPEFPSLGGKIIARLMLNLILNDLKYATITNK